MEDEEHNKMGLFKIPLNLVATQFEQYLESLRQTTLLKMGFILEGRNNSSREDD